MDLSGLNKALDIVNGKKTYEDGKLYDIELSKITVDLNQPRKVFDDEKLLELADDIQQNGIIQPIIVRQQDDMFVIVTGERRFRACKLLNQKTIKAIINKSYTDDKLGYVQIAENLKRDDLKFFELAEFIISKVNAGESQKDIADKLGMQKSEISRYLSWQDAPDYVKENKDKFNSIRAFSDLVSLCTDDTHELIKEFLYTNDLITAKAVGSFRKELKSKDAAQDSVADNGNQELLPQKDESLSIENHNNSSLPAFDAQSDSNSFDTIDPLTSDTSSILKDELNSEELSVAVVADGNEDSSSDNQVQDDDEIDINSSDTSFISESLSSNKLKKPLILGFVDGREAELLYKLCPSTDGFIRVKYEDGFEDEILAENFKINRICEA